jgi:site-specific recombinase XerD
MGANVKQVQQMLGHASATVTLDTYSHVFPSLAEQLREGLEAVYEAATEWETRDDPCLAKAQED